MEAGMSPGISIIIYGCLAQGLSRVLVTIGHRLAGSGQVTDEQYSDSAMPQPTMADPALARPVIFRKGKKPAS